VFAVVEGAALLDCRPIMKLKCILLNPMRLVRAQVNKETPLMVFFQMLKLITDQILKGKGANAGKVFFNSGSGFIDGS